MLYKPGVKPLRIFIAVAVIAGLGFLGYIIHIPIRDAIRGWQSEPEPEPAPAITEPQPIAQSEASPAAEPAAAPDRLRAVYMPPSAVLSAAERVRFLEGLPGEINAVMLDIKDSDGSVLFKTDVNEATEWATVSPGAIDLSALSGELEERGLALIARMGTFGDVMASIANKELAVQYRAPGTAWLDDFAENGGRRWLNPYDKTARKYLIDLAADAAKKGAAMVVLNDLHFPRNSMTSDAYFGETAGITRAGCLKTFADEATLAVERAGGRLCVLMPVSALTAPNLTLYGGEAAAVLPKTVMLDALAYQFEEDYESGGLKLSSPSTDPAGTVRKAVGFAQGATRAGMIVLIQGGDGPEGEAAITAGQVQKQVEELAALGVEEYVLYCVEPGGYKLS
jgi:hypothetical protein